MTPLATSILHRFRAAFADLAELRDPVGAQTIHDAVAAHMRSIAPLAMVAPDPCAEASARLADGASYRVSIQTIEGETLVMLSVNDGDENLCLALTPIEAIRLRADVAAVASSVGGGR